MTSRASLTSLPVEIVTRIASFSDRKSFIALRQVGPGLLSLDRRRLWEQLFFTLPRHFAAQPYVLDPDCGIDEEDVDAEGNSRYRWYLLSQAVTCQAGYCLGLRERVKQIFRMADGDAWSMVKAVTMAPQPTSVHPMMLILDLVSPTLESLAIDAAPHHPHPVEEDVHFPTFELDPGLLDIHMSFPALTCLRITSLSSQYGDFCAALFPLAPNLLSLDLHFDRREPEASADDITADAYSPGRTALRRVRLSWTEHEAWEDRPAAMLSVAILRGSPELREVVLHFGPSVEEETIEQVVAALSRLEKLRELRWPVTRSNGGEYLDDLLFQRLAMGTAAFCPTLTGLAYLPALEELVIGGCPQIGQESATRPSYPTDPDGYPYPDSFHHLAEQLRYFPRLRRLRKLDPTFETDELAVFDRLDDPLQSDRASAGIVTSIRCGDPEYYGDEEATRDSELVQLRYSRQWAVVEGLLTADDALASHSQRNDLLLGRSSHLIPIGEISYQEGVFWRLERAEQCTLADFQGEAVPTEVIQAMKDMSGGDVGDWDRRGVEVKMEVWQILLNWYEALPGRV